MKRKIQIILDRILKLSLVSLLVFYFYFLSRNQDNVYIYDYDEEEEDTDDENETPRSISYFSFLPYFIATVAILILVVLFNIKQSNFRDSQKQGDLYTKKHQGNNTTIVKNIRNPNYQNPQTPTFLTSSKQRELLVNVSDELQTFILQLSGYKNQIKAIDAGAGGDCLFHSINLGLNKMKEKFPDYVTKLEETHNENRQFDMMSIRKISAKGIGNKSEEEFKAFFLNLCVSYYADFSNRAVVWNPLKIFFPKSSEGLGEWKDTWNPFEILGEVKKTTDTKVINQFVKDFTNVIPTFTVLENLTENEINELKSLVMKKFMKTGNSHWGTDADLIFISEILKIGLILFRSKPPNHIYCYNPQTVNQTYQYYMLLYNQEGFHYQLASLIELENTRQTEASASSVYRCTDLPNWLLHTYNYSCTFKIDCPN